MHYGFTLIVGKVCVCVCLLGSDGTSLSQGQRLHMIALLRQV